MHSTASFPNHLGAGDLVGRTTLITYLAARSWTRHPAAVAGSAAARAMAEGAAETDRRVPAEVVERLAPQLRLADVADAARPIAPLALDAAALRDAAASAIRDYGRPDRLSANAFAVGESVADRAASVRARVDAAVERTFGPSRTDVELREVLTAGYLVASAAHERLALDLHLSRSTYFRRLSAALDRAAGQLAADARAAHTQAAEARRVADGRELELVAA